MITPQDMSSWLRWIDVNGLSNEDADNIATIDIDDDKDLRRLLHEWIRPNYENYNRTTRQSMISILKISEIWSARDLRVTFDGVTLPSGQEISDIDRFMAALRGEFVDEF